MRAASDGMGGQQNQLGVLGWNWMATRSKTPKNCEIMAATSILRIPQWSHLMVLYTCENHPTKNVLHVSTVLVYKHVLSWPFRVIWQHLTHFRQKLVGSCFGLNSLPQPFDHHELFWSVRRVTISKCNWPGGPSLHLQAKTLQHLGEKKKTGAKLNT